MKLISKILLVLIVIVALITLLAIFADEIRSVAGLPSPNQEGNSDTQTANTDDIVIGNIKSRLQLEEIRDIVTKLAPEQQKELLSSPETFEQFIQQQQAQKAILGLIKADQVDAVPAVQFIMQKSAEKVLVDWYMNQLIKKNLPEDFPSEEQIKQFYENNADKFIVDDRLHLWQIFIPFSEDTTIDEIKTLQQQAEQIHADLKAGKLSFAAAAREYSSDSPSRENGGYIGLVKVGNLLPVVKDRTLKLKEGEFSQPFKTDKGIHIVKRGAKVDSQVVELGQIREKIREVLQKQAIEEIRSTLVEKAQEQQNTKIESQTMEEWRIKLRAGMQ